MTRFSFLFLFLLLPAFYLVRQEVTFQDVIQHGNHSEVFSYLSNVTNFRVLNPTIIEITHWEQTNETDFYVEYTECLSQVPAVRNYAQGYYTVRPGVDGSLSLISKHFTCFYTNYLCLFTESVLQITKLSNSEVGYKEGISFSCPWALGKFCYDEIAFQRREITTKLKKIFSNTEKLQNIFPQNIH